jgi:hypothetical protein
MAIWNGTHGPKSVSAPQGRRGSIWSSAATAGLMTLLVLSLTAGSAFAAKGGNGGGKGNATTSSVSACAVDGNTVTGYSLPSGEVINFLITDANGTWGWVLGFSDTGTWSVTVPASSGPTTYEFVSRTSGPNGSKYTVFSACTA